MQGIYESDAESEVDAALQKKSLSLRRSNHFVEPIAPSAAW